MLIAGQLMIGLSDPLVSKVVCVNIGQYIGRLVLKSPVILTSYEKRFTYYVLYIPCVVQVVLWAPDCYGQEDCSTPQLYSSLLNTELIRQ